MKDAIGFPYLKRDALHRRLHLCLRRNGDRSSDSRILNGRDMYSVLFSPGTEDKLLEVMARLRETASIGDLIRDDDAETAFDSDRQLNPRLRLVTSSRIRKACPELRSG